MLFLVMCCSVTAFLIIVLLFEKKGKENDIMQRRISFIQMQDNMGLDSELKKSFAERFLIPAIITFRKTLSKFKRKKKKTNTDEKLQNDLRGAGLNITANEFLTIKYIIICIGFIFAFVALIAVKDTIIGVLIALFVLILAFLVPRYFLQIKITMRRNLLKNQIPDVMDILCVSMEAGLGFDASIVKISNRIKGPFVDELTILYKEIQLGKSRRDALRSLGERNTVDEIKTFASATAQAETLGISIQNVLKIQAEQLRTARRQEAEEKGQKAPIKMMIPLVFFIFPVIFIILLGPTAIKLIEQFG